MTRGLFFSFTPFSNKMDVVFQNRKEGDIGKPQVNSSDRAGVGQLFCPWTDFQTSCRTKVIAMGSFIASVEISSCI